MAVSLTLVDPTDGTTVVETYTDHGALDQLASILPGSSLASELPTELIAYPAWQPDVLIADVQSTISQVKELFTARATLADGAPDPTALHTKREVDLTDEEKAGITQARYYTMEGVAMVDYTGTVPPEVMTLSTEDQALSDLLTENLSTLLTFLETGRNRECSLSVPA